MADAPPQPTAHQPEGGAPRPPRTKPNSQTPGENDAPREGGGFDLLLAGSAGWLLSLCLHLGLVLLLALLSLPILPDLELPNLTAGLSPEEEGFDDLPLLDFEEVELSEPLTSLDLTSDALATDAVIESFEPPPASSAAPLPDFGLIEAPSGAGLEQAGPGTGENYGRGELARRAAVRRNGGSEASEAAVRLALEWLARHQNPDGSWSLVHNLGRCDGRCDNPGQFVTALGNPATASLRAGTGLALLPFLGAGQTHREGKHQRTVDRGLRALIDMGRANEKGPGASWADQAGRMYSHGIAAIVLAEAYGITGDSRLGAAAQAAIDYIAYAQGPDGGWRYGPKQIGDTSVTGWQVMALKSGFLANLRVPPRVASGAYRFFDTVQHNGGAGYAYLANPPPQAIGFGEPTPTLSAVALLGRMYLGWQNNRAALVRGAEALARVGPSENNVYLNYYAAQVLFQYTSGEGELWRAWNEPMREQLIAQQETTGHARGSWFVDSPPGTAEHGHNRRGGRLYQTSLATMTLEVYYRYLPIYKLGTKSVEVEP